MENKVRSVAVLMTCHNRRETTIHCLDTLYGQKNTNNIYIDVFLVDDGSTDGTSKAVSNKYPDINILEGDGSLYWTGGMRKAMKAAREKGYDFYLWLNDDTVLFPNAFKTLFETYEVVAEEQETPPIISGNLWDPKRKNVSYGGYKHSSNWHPLRFKRLTPGKTPQRCDVINGNVVLLSDEVVNKVGNLHPQLKHAKGDYEYALRAEKKGIFSWVTSGYVGECPRNNIDGTWKDTSLSIVKRYKKIFSAKGEPLYPRMVYYSEYGGIFWPIFFLGVYIRPFLDTFKR